MRWVLHEPDRSVDGRKARFVLADKGIEFTVRPQPAPERSSLLGHGTGSLSDCPPRLELGDGTHVDGWVAVAVLSDELHPEPPLLGTDSLERALVTMWRRRIDERFTSAVDALIGNGSPRIGSLVPWPVSPDMREGLRDHLELLLVHLEAALAQHRFVACNRFTVADISAFCTLDAARALDLRPSLTDWRVRRWLRRVARRPGAQAARQP